jgi:NitT/TauT family transport system substrate-binding protein
VFAAAILVTFTLAAQSGDAAAAAPMKVTIHIPSKSLSIMPYYFGKDKGFFAAEGIEPEFVMMAPPTAIAALIAGELDFSSTTGAATSAMMRGLPLRRMFYVQQDPAHVLLSQPEIRSIEELSGKTIGVTALTDAVGMSANVILRANGLDASRVTLLAMQITDNNIKALTTRKIAATLLAPPYAQELEAKGYNKLAEARTYAPLSFIGLDLSTQSGQSQRGCPVRRQLPQARSGARRKSFHSTDAGVQQRRHQAAQRGRAGDRNLPRDAEDHKNLHARRFGRFEFVEEGAETLTLVIAVSCN